MVDVQSNDPERIVRWEILKGLPGDGPVPRNVSSKPWREGFVVRFWNASGSHWVGHFGGCGGMVLDWDEADLVVVETSGLLYFLSKKDPTSYVARGGDVTNFIFDEERARLICARVGGKLTAFGRRAEILWTSGRVAVDEIKLKSCVGGVITAEADDRDCKSWHTLRISVADGSTLK